jgi:hypothetical protein
LAVDVNNISKEVLVFSVLFGAPKGSIVVITLRSQSDGNVVVSPLWQPQNLLFFFIMHDIKALEEVRYIALVVTQTGVGKVEHTKNDVSVLRAKNGVISSEFVPAWPI